MRVRRLPIVDEYTDGDQVAVFVGGQVVVLSAVASIALLSLGDEWTDLTSVAEAVVRVAGPPPGGSAGAAVAEVVTQLQDLGLVEAEA